MVTDVLHPTAFNAPAIHDGVTPKLSPGGVSSQALDGTADILQQKKEWKTIWGFPKMGVAQNHGFQYYYLEA